MTNSNPLIAPKVKVQIAFYIRECHYRPEGYSFEFLTQDGNYPLEEKSLKKVFPSSTLIHHEIIEKQLPAFDPIAAMLQGLDASIDNCREKLEKAKVEKKEAEARLLQLAHQPDETIVYEHTNQQDSDQSPPF